MGKINDALERSGIGPKPENKEKENLKSLTEGTVRQKIQHKIPSERNINTQDNLSHTEQKEFIQKTTSRSTNNGKGMDSNLVVFHKPQSMEAEFFKILKTNILFPSKGTPPRSILVTSAVPGEGKSFVTANLAISIAQGIEEHVLLIDCDMRRPTIHSKFGIPGVIGLNEHLTKGIPLPALLEKTAVEKLSILPVGGLPNNPTELLSSVYMKKLLDEVKHRYKDRFVLLDSPPPQLTAETSALAKRVDGVLLVIKAEKTPRKLVNELIEQIGKEKIIGVVLNWYNIPFTKYYGYGKYNKYYNNE
ncbi:MAG: polysaccharide biosynthesis tyrosine autokinase [Desulfobacteraceae bacterium]|jgi:exopolysaccharide/PEP-CTERM locus tyrosine autokinase